MTAVLFGKFVYPVPFIFAQLQTFALCILIEGFLANVADFVSEIGR